MLRILILLVIIQSLLVSLAHANETPRTTILTTMRRLETHTNYYPNDPDLAARLSQAMGITVTKPSPSYYLMKSGAMVIGPTEYALINEHPELPAEVIRLSSESQNRQLELSEFNGPYWVHMIKPIDNEEENCLWIGRVNNRPVGCGDIWQNGLNEDEVVCIGTRTYSKCQVDCIKRIYHRENVINARPGFCPGVAP